MSLKDQLLVLIDQQHFGSQGIAFSQAPPANAELREFVVSCGKEALLDVLDEIVNDPDGSLKTVVNMILQASPKGEETSLLAHAIFYHLLKKASEGDLDENRSLQVVQIISTKLPMLSSDSKADLLKFFIESLQSGKDHNGVIWEVLPNLVASVEVEESVLGFDDVQMTGKEMKEEFIRKIGSVAWPAQCSIKLVIALRETDIGGANLLMVLKKALKQLNVLNPQDYPVLVHNILLFSGKQFGVVALEGIIKHFTLLDSKMKTRKKSLPSDTEPCDITIRFGDNIISEETLRKVEGDALWKINFTAKNNKAVGALFLKSVKEDPPKHSPFFVATFFSLALENKNAVIDYFKNTIINQFHDVQYRHHSPWLRGLLGTRLSNELIRSFLETVSNGADWDTVLPSLVELSFVLIDSSVGATLNPKYLLAEKDLKRSSPAIMGTQILKNSFFACPTVQKKIFDEILSRILTSNFLQSSQTMESYLNLLTKLIQNSPHEIADKYASKIRDMVDYLPKLQPNIAAKIIESLHPLYNYHTGLRDNVILVLRKAMFSVDIDARKVSVNGFLSLLSWLTVRKENPKLQEESLNSLRRCLSQQLEIREELYSGLVSLYETNEKLRPTILQILYYQFQKYYSEDSNPPINIAQCFKKNSSQLQEPLPVLLISLLKILTCGSPPSELMALFDTLLDKLISIDLEEYELVASAQIDIQTPEGETLTQTATILADIIGILIEFKIIVGGEEAMKEETIITLHTKRESIGTFLKELKQKVPRGKAANKLSLGFHLFDLKHIPAILELISNQFPEIEEVDSSDPDLGPSVKHCELFVTCLQSINQTFKTLHANMQKGNRLAEDLMRLAEQGLPKCAAMFQQTFQNTRAIHANFAALQVLESSVAIITTQQTNEELVAFLKQLNANLLETDTNTCIDEQIQSFEQICALIAPNDKQKARPLLLKVILSFSSRLSKDFVPRHRKWAEDEILKSNTEVPHVVVNACLEYYLNISRVKLFPYINIARELRFLLGECDQKIEPPQTIKTFSFDMKAAGKFLTTLMNHISPLIQELEWAIDSLKTIHKKSHVLEIAVAKRIADLSGIMLHVASTRISNTTHIRQAFRIITKVYKISTSFIQYLISISKDPHEKIAACFAEIGKLSEVVNQFLEYLHNSKVKASKADAALNKQLIFELERCQTQVVKYSKKTKTDYMKLFKRTIARAFRIDQDIVHALDLPEKKKRKSAEPASGIVTSDEDSENSEAPAKRQKHSNSGVVDSSPEFDAEDGIEDSEPDTQMVADSDNLVIDVSQE